MVNFLLKKNDHNVNKIKILLKADNQSINNLQNQFDLLILRLI